MCGSVFSNFGDGLLIEKRKRHFGETVEKRVRVTAAIHVGQLRARVKRQIVDAKTTLAT